MLTKQRALEPEPLNFYESSAALDEIINQPKYVKNGTTCNLHFFILYWIFAEH